VEGNNGLISKFLLLLDVSEGFWGIGIRRGAAGREGEFCGEFFLTESDGF